MLERRRENLPQKIGWLLILRLVLALFSIAIIAITAGEDLRESRFYPAYFLLIAVCFADLIYLVIYRIFGASESFTILQVVLDVLFVTMLILLSGGARSSFSFLYYAIVLAAANLISRRSALFFASLATVLLSGVSISYYLANKYDAALPLVSPLWLDMAKLNFNSVLAFLVAQGVALHLVGLLAGRLAVRVADISALYREILENMTQGILVADSDNNILYGNKEAARLLKITYSNQLAFQKLDDILPPKIGKDVAKLMDALKNDMPDTRIETNYNDKGIKNIEIKTSALRDSRDKRAGTIILLADLTLRRRLEESQKRVERLQEIEEMSAGLAHEIRNPLASIRGCTQELGKQNFHDSTNSKLAEIVCRESDRLDTIVNDFLNLARMKPPVFRRVDLGPIVEEVVILMRSREDTKNIHIIDRVKEKLNVYCDPEQIKQVLLNLGINSLESLNGHGYISFGIKRMTASESAIKGSNLLDAALEGYIIEVEDNGSGINEEDLPKIFTPFFTTKQRGTGMGLAIAYRIILEHNGLIEVQANSKKGTRIKIWLPLYPRTVLRSRDKKWIQK